MAQEFLPSDMRGPVRVKKAGVQVGERRALNFVEGSNITLTIADDSDNDDIDITVTGSGGGGGALGASLTALDTLTPAADRLPYFTGAASAALATFTAAGRAIVDDPDAAAQRTTLGLGTIATQAAATVAITGGAITGITDLAIADGGTGASDAATARANLGLGAVATLATINDANWSGTDLAIANGGTGASTAAAARTALGLNEFVIPFLIDGGGSVITTGIKGWVEIPAACTITGWTILADQSGSIVVDVKRSTYGDYPTTVSLAGSEKPTLVAVQKNQDLALGTWTTAVVARDILECVVDSASTVTRVSVNLRVQV
jgi:hypothetical protein